MQLKSIKNHPLVPYALLRTIYVVFKLAVEYFTDFTQYCRSSSLIGVKSNEQLLARISAHSHMIEKGLCMKPMKPSFGVESNLQLIDLIKQGLNIGLKDKFEVVSAISALKQYQNVHKEHGIEINSVLEEKMNSLFSNLHIIDTHKGGKKEITKKDLLLKWSIDFHSYIRARHSIRSYTNEPIDNNTIEKCIDSANYSPSVCNRQTSRVLIIDNESEIKKALQYQNGNRGFGHLATKLLVVMSDIRYFNDLEERNQNFIDGGLFSMSLLLALQSEGIGACPLNWCVSHKTDKAFKEAFDISGHYSVIMFISLGQIPEKLEVAISKRKTFKNL
jgi:nitroreductase